MHKNLGNKLRKILPILGIILLAYTIYSLDIEKIKNAFFSIKPIFVFLSLSLIIPHILLRNYSWKLILKEHKIKLSFLQSLKIFLIGYFYATMTPGFVGKILRITYIKDKTGEPYGKLFVNTVIESIVHISPLFAMVVLGSLFLIETIPEMFFFSICFVITLFIILFYFLREERGERVFLALIKYLIPEKMETSLYNFVGTFYRDFPKVKKLLFPTFIGFFTWILVFSQYYMFVWALDLDIPYFYFILIFPVASLIGMIPISFAGIGTRELTAVTLFSFLFSISGEKILVVSLLGFFISDIVTGLIGFVLSLTESTKRLSFLPFKLFR